MSKLYACDISLGDGLTPEASFSVRADNKKQAIKKYKAWLNKRMVITDISFLDDIDYDTDGEPIGHRG